MAKRRKFSARERHILLLLYPNGSIAPGLSVCGPLELDGYLELNYRRHRYVLTDAGRLAASSLLSQPR